ncbi:bifunctional folylpolyglutamate synthase/dihydrofolate synthase [Chloroflexota bacterium]
MIRLENDRFQQALDYIYSFVNYETEPRPRDAAHYDLRRMDELLVRLGNPHLNTSTVHITGTKGKGSVAAMITSTLTTAGYKAGLYTSPHLHVFNERIRIDDRLISDDEVITLVEKIKPEVSRVNEKATYGTVTTFEVITALGFSHFRQQGADLQVIEVGLGGRLDATNVVRPKVCIITSISLEHTDVLGDTLAEIAGEKAGIIKPGSVVISSRQANEVNRVIEQTCRDCNTPLIKMGEDVTWENIESSNYMQSFTVNGVKNKYELSIPLLGQYQVENAAVAVTALECLVERGFSISKKHISDGLAKVDWPGRLQVLNRRPMVIVDGAHNPNSVQKLGEALQQYFGFTRGILIIGASADKDISGMVAELVPLFDRAIITRSIHPRSMDVDPLVDEFRKYGTEVHITDDISDALPMALEMSGEEDIICVTGSLFVVAGAIEQAEELGLSG